MDLKGVVDAMFASKQNWSDVTDRDKESMFFIVNRFFAKKYPKQAQFFNQPGVDKASAMDVWFAQMKKENRTPFWFWQGPTKRKDPPVKDWQVVQEFWKVGLNDIYMLCELFPEEVKQEVKRIQLINTEREK